MPCLAIILALALPRLTIALLWFFTTWFHGVFDNVLWPILGFLVAPFTLLWFSTVQNWWGGSWGPWQVVGLVIAILMDLSPGAGKRR